MLLLIFYVVIALGFSFLCSIAEAVILSVSSAYISVLEKEGRPSGALLRKQTDNINTPLSAILTLNTIAHTMGAAGAGAPPGAPLRGVLPGAAERGTGDGAGAAEPHRSDALVHRPPRRGYAHAGCPALAP